jgi:hypothetical protein
MSEITSKPRHPFRTRRKEEKTIIIKRRKEKIERPEGKEKLTKQVTSYEPRFEYITSEEASSECVAVLTEVRMRTRDVTEIIRNISLK